MFLNVFLHANLQKSLLFIHLCMTSLSFLFLLNSKFSFQQQDINKTGRDQTEPKCKCCTHTVHSQDFSPDENQQRPQLSGWALEQLQHVGEDPHGQRLQTHAERRRLQHPEAGEGNKARKQKSTGFRIIYPLFVARFSAFVS